MKNNTQFLFSVVQERYHFFIKNHPHIRYSFGIFFILIGIFFLLYLTFFQYPNSSIQKVASAEPIVASDIFKERQSSSQVTRIIIPSLAIDLEVKPSKLVNGYWETSEISASHGEFTANPGEKSNVVIFAHAREGLFINLKNGKIDDVIYVLTNAQWFSYRISQIKEVYPNQVEVIKPTPSETLTLFTCSGFFDEKRLVITALPSK